jgi:hypothetical protein
MLLSETDSLGGLTLVQTDIDSGNQVKLSSTLQIRGGGPTIPEPSILLLMGIGLISLIATRRRMHKA